MTNRWIGQTLTAAWMIFGCLGDPSVARETDDAAAASGIVEQSGGTIRRIAQSEDGIEVSFQFADHPVTEEALKALSSIPHVTWLYLQGTQITDDHLRYVGQLKELTRLHLERTPIGDAGLTHLTALDKLEYLNLYGTQVSDEGLQHLQGLGNLTRVFLWQTKVTDNGAARLRAALPNAQVMLGADPLPADPQETQKSAETPPAAPRVLAQGRFVRVRLEGAGRTLSLAEVEVFAKDSETPLHTAGTATQSSTAYAAGAQRASDGNTSQVFDHQSVSHTERSDNPWWLLDLGEVQDLGRIKVWNRGDCCGPRLEGAIVEVLDADQEVVWTANVEQAAPYSVHAFGGD